MRRILKGHNDPLEESTAERLAKQYRVSPKTIRRGTKIFDAINAIGEASLEDTAV